MTDHDVIDEVLAIAPGDRLDAIRAARPTARENAQRSFDALFSPLDTGEVDLAERYAVATFVAGLSREARLSEYYSAGLESESHASVVAALHGLVDSASTTGPYGRYREAGLAGESTEGPRLEIDSTLTETIGPRLATALEHAHLLVFRPREASPAALQRLLDAGWSVDGIVTLSQLIAFVSFQLRIVIGLSALQADLDGAPVPASAPTRGEGTQ